MIADLLRFRLMHRVQYRLGVGTWSKVAVGFVEVILPSMLQQESLAP